MKQHFSLVFTLALLMAVSFGCKVGADDPATLASRDSRLMGDWKLTAVVDSVIDINALGTFVTSYSYDGTILTRTSPFGTSTDSYTLLVSIAKGGVLTTTEIENGDIKTGVDYWEWMGNDKNKSQVLLNDQSMVSGIWDVQRLASKELILYRHTMETNVNSGSLESREETMRLTFIAD
jgi:hypothetical protein